MLEKKQKRVLVILDVLELLLLLATLIIFTVVFKIVEEPIRYAFLIGDIFVITSFSKALTSLEEMIEKRKKQTKSTNVVSEISI